MADEQGANDHPLISVVVPVRNGMPWIEQQLQALSTQDVPAGWEVMVADNGSDDGTRSCVERWSARDPRIHLVDASARRGAAAARNMGVRSARAGFLAFCDADDVVRPGWVASMLLALRDAELVAGVFDFGALDGAPKSLPAPAATRQLGFLPFGLSANLAVRRDVFDAVHGFDEEPVTGRGRRPVLAAPTGGIPVRRGGRCHRGEARACRGTTHVPRRLGLRTVRAAALRALPRRGHAARRPGGSQSVGLVGDRPARARPAAPTSSVGADVCYTFRPARRFAAPPGVLSVGHPDDARRCLACKRTLIRRSKSCRHEEGSPP